MPDLPHPDDVTAAGHMLGVPTHPERGGRMRTRDRAKTMRAIQVAETLDDNEDDESPDFAATLASTHSLLTEAGLTTTAADRIVAAIAPAVWRDTTK
ncbi:hypothetical protein GS894_02925 [Rhodococcus hoagii]|nr:hypothetical protein [Prescottella equi]NKS02649.1 hypothetical protein [Prescottella equi]NKS06742.1 hypothetical protein [Prescottella equi]NKT07370.1 hypothetical protein [Prescottella equi]NKT31657.1 hypothetical protein [Prescottella equi]